MKWTIHEIAHMVVVCGSLKPNGVNTALLMTHY